MINKRPVQIAYALMLLGTLVRCIHLFLFDFVHEPFHLGGLFLAFADEIASHRFHLPVTIPYYSAGGIPFAYPPLGFYVEAVFVKLFPASSFAIVNLLPPLIAICTLGITGAFFHGWAKGWNVKSLSALAVFAFVPNSFYNQIEAAGLAETFGSLALITYFILLFDHRQKRTWRSALLAGLGLALCVLASPGSALAAPLISIIFAVVTFVELRWSEKFQPYLYLLLIAFVGLVVSSPYWLTVIHNHGIGVFTAPAGNQYVTITPTRTVPGELQALWFTYGALQLELGYLLFITLLLGCGWQIWKQRDYLLPTTFLVLFSIPRENAWITAFPLALLVGLGVAEVIIPYVRSRLRLSVSVKSLALMVMAGSIVVIMLFQAFGLIQVMIDEPNMKLDPPTSAALQQAQSVIPTDAAVIVLGNSTLREWSPYLLRREVINTEYGLEWKPKEYQIVMMANQALKSASDWSDVDAAVESLTSGDQVYIVIQPGYPLPDGSADSESISTVMDVPALKVVLLSLSK